MTDTYLIWFAIAGVLLIIEMLSFSTYSLWIAIGAGLTGVLAWVYPTLSHVMALLVFSVFSGLGLLIGNKFFSSNKIQRTDDNILNQRGNQYINQLYTLEEDIIDGRGHLKISDTIWRIECNTDLAQGIKVKVIAVNGNRLIVEAYYSEI